MSTEPVTFQRDERGLVKGVAYHYTAEGRIDWKRMIDPRFLYVIRDKEPAVVKAQGKPIAEADLSLVDERWLRIKLAGFNQLANLRGYRSIQYHSLTATPSKAAVVCEIEFIGNAETEGFPVICSAIASATMASTGADFSPYLETFAENRSFARCVKRALQINILSDEEADAEALAKLRNGDDVSQEAAVADQPAPSGFDACDELIKACRDHRDAKGTAAPIGFEALRAAAIKLNAENPPSTDPAKPATRTKADPATWTTFKDIERIDAWLLLGKIREKEAAAKAAPTAETPKARKATKQP